MLYVNNFEKQKVVDYLLPGKKVLLVFQHGLGDCIMFMPLYKELCRMYPTCKIDVCPAPGREGLFPEREGLAMYDTVCLLTFHETPDKEGSYSKPEYCCKYELGIDFRPGLDFTWEPPTTNGSPFVGVNFMCNSNPNYNVPYRVARHIWDSIIEAGFIPFEVYFEHMQYNCRNAKYDFITNTARGAKASVESFFNTMVAMRGFIGVNSGSLIAAIAMYPELTLHLHTKHDLQYYHKAHKIDMLDVTKYDQWDQDEDILLTEFFERI